MNPPVSCAKTAKPIRAWAQGIVYQTGVLRHLANTVERLYANATSRSVATRPLYFGQ